MIGVEVLLTIGAPVLDVNDDGKKGFVVQEFQGKEVYFYSLMNSYKYLSKVF